MEKYLDITKARYSEHILPAAWHFVISRFHCIAKLALLLLGLGDGQITDG